ncbi:hypothetical protein [Catelliglobosispora koreensis]|uniref:hypothetical protein n=1 Tax=Catelliglobosispora koreensis TaxID=129052 RepID=UPI0012FB2CE8|nr:hypothetical protein [Catelliglobosispora koreensis]
MRAVIAGLLSVVLWAQPVSADNPPQVRLCFGLVQMLDGAARMRMALVSGDATTLRLAARSVEQGYEDAREASVELGGPNLDTATSATAKVTALATIANVIRQPGVFVPPLDELVAETTKLASEADCSTVLTQLPTPTPTPS